PARPVDAEAPARPRDGQLGRRPRGRESTPGPYLEHERAQPPSTGDVAADPLAAALRGPRLAPDAVGTPLPERDAGRAKLRPREELRPRHRCLRRLPGGGGQAAPRGHRYEAGEAQAAATHPRVSEGL